MAIQPACCTPGYTYTLFSCRFEGETENSLFDICNFFLTILFSLPKFTYNQAQEIVMEKYEVISEKEKIIPVNDSGFHAFALTHFYFFKVRSMDAELKVMVNPDTGEIIELR
ncbi:MAG TPA: hypothetical protein DCR24_14810 [Bacillus bacterium]|nr:hypothetical protein [Bacillus sp. (in: firmicutes)]